MVVVVLDVHGLVINSAEVPTDVIHADVVGGVNVDIVLKVKCGDEEISDDAHAVVLDVNCVVI